MCVCVCVCRYFYHQPINYVLHNPYVPPKTVYNTIIFIIITNKKMNDKVK